MATVSTRRAWYQHGDGFFGNLYWQWLASAVYFVLAFLPLVIFAINDYNIDSVKTFAKSGVGLAWAFFVATGYPLWTWGEVRAFERWADTQPSEISTRERAYFKLMTDCSKNFWAGVLATYTIAGLWALAGR
jgi:hypothetical protein